jgi:hypothetical protein
MSDLLVALGLVLVIEGVLWAVFPSTARLVVEYLATTDEGALRQAGLIAVAIGFVIVWLVRG